VTRTRISKTPAARTAATSRVVALVGVFIAAAALAHGGAGWDRPLPQKARILQLLNRVTFGPRPDDFDTVQRIGIHAFLERQLHPERIDDSAVEARIASLPTLSMTSSELVEAFPPPNLAGRRSAAEETSMNEAARPRRILVELAREEIWRAVYGERQLEEVMVQFWMNHFNIFAPKGADKWLVTSFERDTIRPHALGNFEDLLVATAKSPAMLFYLDNWLSAAPVAAQDGSPIRGAARRARRNGLNENYARELMELHTLGVDGGYTQKDVTEVARAFTGWTLDRPRRRPEFVFAPRLHDAGEKSVLGERIPAGGGIDDGMRILHHLAHHPSTARFIALKLCRRFVADAPPPTLVERASRRFLDSGGEIREVLRTILESPEFYSEAAYRAKVKSPIELAASALRAFDGETDAGLPLLFFIARMGQPMFQYQAPSGFADRASTWIDPAHLLVRMKFAAALATGRIAGTRIDPRRALAEPGIAEVVATDESAESPQARVALYVASPEFQHH
jgi:uncharacterized protein (DUF1800 family)